MDTLRGGQCRRKRTRRLITLQPHRPGRLTGQADGRQDASPPVRIHRAGGEGLTPAHEPGLPFLKSDDSMFGIETWIQMRRCLEQGVSKTATARRLGISR